MFIVQSISVGFLDAIIDGMLVQAANKDGVKNGAEIFQTMNTLV